MARNLGMVTAYAYAVAGGYTGTEAEFEELLGNIADDLSQIENLSVTVTTLTPGSSATASYSDGVLSLGIPAGDKGDIGETPDLSIGTVTTLSAGADATATITGTAENPVLNLGLPKGADGSLASGVLASTYSTSKTYAVGDYVYYSGNLYRCTTAITTAESFTAAHWTQVVLADDVSDLKSDIDELTDKSSVDFSNSVDGFVRADGSYYSGSGYKTSAPFQLKKMHTLVCISRGYRNSEGSVVTIISRYNSDGTYTPLVDSASNSTQTYTYTPSEDMQCVICYDNAITPKGEISVSMQTIIDGKADQAEFEQVQNDVNSVAETETITITSYTDGYVNQNGIFVSGVGYRMSQVIDISAGMHISVTSRGYTNPGVVTVAIISEYKAGKYIPLVLSRSSSTELYEYDAPRDMQIVICYDNVMTPSGSASRNISNVYDVISSVTNIVDNNNDISNYELEQIDRRLLKAEKANDFAWKTFDKPYFIFVHDDTNQYLEGYEEVFNDADVPMSAATIPNALTETHIATLNNMVANGGEVLAHFDGSIYQTSSDAEWLSITRDGKRTLENLGFEIRGIVNAGNSDRSSEKGEKYCRRYFDYAVTDVGKSTQYKLPRDLMLNYASLTAFKAQIDIDSQINGIHAYGFHGGREDEAWITNTAMAEIIEYIKAKSNCEFTTYSELFDSFGSNALEQRILALENA